MRAFKDLIPHRAAIAFAISIGFAYWLAHASREWSTDFTLGVFALGSMVIMGIGLPLIIDDSPSRPKPRTLRADLSRLSKLRGPR